MLVIPLWEKGVVTGTLKIYYCHAHRITSSLQEMAVGLSQIISTQLEVPALNSCVKWPIKPTARAAKQNQSPFFI
jgi:two-component system LytT family sensor kinase